MRRGDPTLYGRFDLSYDGVNEPKMLEYNADTPTLLIETAVTQWHWLQDKFPTDTPDQFNSAHEKLIELFRKLNRSKTFHFSSVKESLEEWATVEYIRDCASQAGVATKFVFIEDLGWSGTDFVDDDGEALKFWFKLYPWEWLAAEQFGKNIPAVSSRLGIVEPAWKMILSNKGILPILWELFPDHPNLLPSFWDRPAQGNFIEKPILGREGANIRIWNGNEVALKTEGRYGDSPCIFQKMAPLPVIDGQHVLIGSWIIGDQAAGMCVREDENHVIVSHSKIVPHIFR